MMRPTSKILLSLYVISLRLTVCVDSVKLDDFNKIDAFNRDVCGMNSKLMSWQEAGDGFECSSEDNDDDDDCTDDQEQEDNVDQTSAERGQAKKRLSFGYEPEEGEFPFHAEILWSTGYCQGALIHRDLLITAGHCTTRLRNLTGNLMRSDVRVHLGTVDQSNGRRRGETVGAKWGCQMKDYKLVGSRPTSLNDVGLIKLSRPVKYSDTIRPVCLDFNRRHLASATCVHAGFGKTSNEESVPMRLRALPHKLYTSHNDTRNDRSWYIAAHSTWAGSSCEGDSGSALVCYDKCSKSSARAYAVGVVIDAEPYTCIRGLSRPVEVADFNKLKPLMEEMFVRCFEENEKE